MGPERARSTIDGGYELEAGSSGLYCLERAPWDTACMSRTRSTIDGGYELEAGSSGLYCL